jgi:hypothetical protein
MTTFAEAAAGATRAAADMHTITAMDCHDAPANGRLHSLPIREPLLRDDSAPLSYIPSPAPYGRTAPI